MLLALKGVELVICVSEDPSQMAEFEICISAVCPERAIGSLTIMFDPQVFAKLLIDPIVALASAVSVVEINEGRATAEMIPRIATQIRISVSESPSLIDVLCIFWYTFRDF